MEYEGFRLHPDWEPIAAEKNPFRMANVLYTDLKKHVYEGVLPPREAVDEMINVVKFVLERDFYWNREQIDEFEEQFIQLNQYYSPEEKIREMVEQNKERIHNSQLPDELKALLSRLSDGGADVHITTVGPDGQIMRGFEIPVSPVETQPQIPQKELDRASERVVKWAKLKSKLKLAFVVFFKAMVYWLALFGLLTLLGL